MRLQPKFLGVLSISLLFALVSCEKDPKNTPTPTPPQPPTTTDQGHLVYLSTISGPSGAPEATYLVSTRDMKPGSYTNRDGYPLEVATFPYYHKGTFYAFPGLMGSKISAVTVLDAQHGITFNPLGSIPVPGNSGTTGMALLSESKAYLSNYHLGTISVINPTTRTILKTIDLNKYAQPNVKVRPAMLIIRDGLLFVGLNQIDEQWKPLKAQADMAIIDTQTDEVSKIISDKTHGMSFCTRPIDENSLFIDEAGDLYVNCLGAFESLGGKIQAGLLRIKKGQTEFDPDYALELDKVMPEGTEGHKVEVLQGIIYTGDGTIVAQAGITSMDPNYRQNPYTALTCVLVSIDLKKGTIQRITDSAPSMNLTYGLTYDGKRYVYYGVANKTQQGIFRYDTHTKHLDPKDPYLQVEGYVTGLRYIPAK